MTSFSLNPYRLVSDTDDDLIADILALTTSPTGRRPMDDDIDDYEYQQLLAESGEDYGR
jgi:hypothetical protein